MDFTEITLHTTHLQPIKLFYSEVMGLPVSESNGEVLISAGNSKLHFRQSDTMVLPYYHLAFNVPSNLFDSAFNWFRSSVPLLPVNTSAQNIAEYKAWNARSFYFYDPAGNILEIIARYDLPEGEGDTFSGKSITCISELGIVFACTNFSESVQKFMDKYDLSFFEKQPPFPNFMVAGDQHGLFIMVPEGRFWAPHTNRKAVCFPMSVTFEVQGVTHEWTA